MTEFDGVRCNVAMLLQLFGTPGTEAEIGPEGERWVDLHRNDGDRGEEDGGLVTGGMLEDDNSGRAMAIEPSSSLTLPNQRLADFLQRLNDGGDANNVAEVKF